MKEKLYKVVSPYGKLYAEGREYWLLSPQPLPKDSWQHDQQQTWLVVPNDPLGWNKAQSYQLYSFARHVVVSNPLLEFYNAKPILVWDGEEEVDIPEEADYGFNER